VFDPTSTTPTRTVWMLAARPDARARAFVLSRAMRGVIDGAALQATSRERALYVCAGGADPFVPVDPLGAACSLYPTP
jgi:hypothetical protein